MISLSQKARSHLRVFCYNEIMDYITVVINSFWAIMAQATTIFVPVIAILLIFGIIRGVLFNER